MSGIKILLLLLLVSSIPAVATFLWFRLCRYPFTFLRFMFSLLAGAASFFPALFLQNFFAGRGVFPAVSGKWRLFGEIFIRTALTEELGRLIVLFTLFWLIRRFCFGTNSGESVFTNRSESTGAAASMGAMGLVAGFGFAILESAVYGVSNPGNTVLRVFTAAPLHGACGSRVGFSLAMFPQNPIRALFKFFTAVIIHGIYNYMLVIPGRLPSVTAVLVALSALASSILTIRNGMDRNGTDA